MNESSYPEVLGNHSYAELYLAELNRREVRLMAPVIGFLLLIMTTGIMGNSATCYICKKKMKRTKTNTFIIWLAVLDLSICIVGIPFQICTIVFAYMFNQPVLCKLLFFYLVFALITSFQTLSLITIDRYYKICRPLQQSPIRNTRNCIVGSVICGIIVSSPTLALFRTIEIPTPKADIVGYGCESPSSVFALIFFGSYLVLNFSSVFCLSTLYILIVLQVRKRSRMEIGNQKGSESLNRPRYKAHTATVVCAAITIGFILAYFPTLVLDIIVAHDAGFIDSLSNISSVVYNIFTRSFFLTSTINPFIYGVLNPTFRKEFVLILRRLKPCRKYQADAVTSGGDRV